MPGIWLIFFFTILYGGHGDFSKAFWICITIISVVAFGYYIKECNKHKKEIKEALEGYEKTWGKGDGK